MNTSANQLHVLHLPLSNFRVLTRRARLDRLVQNDHVPLIGFAASKATNANHCRLDQEKKIPCEQRSLISPRRTSSSWRYERSLLAG